jgi:dipeptidyl aminopeptidase/acylaminoacyl peptidase
MRVLLPVAGILLAAAAARAADARAPLTPETLWQIQRLASPAVSPDGAWVAVALTTYEMKDDKGQSDLWLVPTAGGEARQLTTADSSESGPAWSPDGKWIAFESKRGDDENGQIYVIPTAGGEARRVTKVPTGAAAPKWFPDSRRIAFISRVWPELKTWEEQGKRQKERKDSKVTARVYDTAGVRYWDHWLDDREAHVYTIAREGGDTTAVTLGTGRQLSRAEPGTGSYDVSPDGKEVAFAADTDATGVDANFDVFVVPATGGTARNLTTDNPAADGGPSYSPDGRFLAFSRQAIKGFYGDTARLALHDRQAGTNRVVTSEWDRSVGAIAWAPDGARVYSAIDDAGSSRLYAIDVATGQRQALTRQRSYGSASLSRDGNTLVALRESFTEPPTLVKVDPRGGEATKLSTFNDALLAKVEWGSYESVTYKGAGGADIQMWVNYPPGFDAKKRYPSYLLIHGGPHNGVTDAFQWRWQAQVFSGWGYVTAWPNFHGSSGFGQAFTDSINPNWADQPYEDVIKAAEYLAAQPYVDKDRMAAGGGSYGGYLVSVLLGRPHPFKALVCHAGVTNLYTQYAADFGAGKRRHGEFWEQDAIFRQTSPHFAAGSFKTPTLVIAGGRDYRVPDNNGIELFNILQNRGVRSRFVHYPDENHWVLKPQNSVHWYGQTRDWLREFIGDGAGGPRPGDRSAAR